MILLTIPIPFPQEVSCNLPDHICNTHKDFKHREEVMRNARKTRYNKREEIHLKDPPPSLDDSMAEVKHPLSTVNLGTEDLLPFFKAPSLF